MTWFQVSSFPLADDLAPLLTKLTQTGIASRITEESGRQILWLVDESHREPVLNFIQSSEFEPWLQQVGGAKPLKSKRKANINNSPISAVSFLFMRFPMTLLLIIGACLGALLVELDSQFDWIRLLTFQPLIVEGDKGYFYSVQSGLEAGQWWRLITPVFLHFGILHLVFNSLWVWDFGRRLELALGSMALLFIVVVTGVVSNAAQYYWSGPSLFGGLSGVVYGLLGWLWVYHRLNPSPLTELNPVLVGMLMVWLLLCMTGALDFFVGGGIANAAHLGGLLIGMLLGLLMGRYRTVKGGRSGV